MHLGRCHAGCDRNRKRERHRSKDRVRTFSHRTTSGYTGPAVSRAPEGSDGLRMKSTEANTENARPHRCAGRALQERKALSNVGEADANAFDIAETAAGAN
jgi:hypothetical protein